MSDTNYLNSPNLQRYSEGISSDVLAIELRDQLAAAVITGLTANEHTNHFTAEKFALNAYAVADAMLVARSKPIPKETE